MIYDSWFYVSNDLLVDFYSKAVERKGNNNLIQEYFSEIKRRNLRVDKRNHLKRIK